MGDKGPAKAPPAPAQAPMPPVAGPAGLQDQALLGNAAVQGQMGVGSGVGGGGTPTLAKAAQQPPPDAGGGDDGGGGQRTDVLFLHMVETTWGKRKRLKVMVEADGTAGTKAEDFDYIAGLENAVAGGSLHEREGVKRLLLEKIALADKSLQAMAGTGEVRLPPEQQAAIAARVAYIRDTVAREYDVDITPAPPAAAADRERWEWRIYNHAIGEDADVSKGNPGAPGTYTGAGGQVDETTTGKPPPKKPEAKPTEEEPPSKPPTPPKAEEGPLPPKVIVLFAQDKDQGDPKALAVLKQYCNAGHLFEVTAFASAEGDAAYNLALSQRRANWVKQVLNGLGATDVDVTAMGKGEEGKEGAEASEKGRDAATKRGERERWRRAEVVVSRRPAPAPPR